jgi:integrase
MPRPRLNINNGLPKRWRFTHGAYYYSVPKGCEQHWEGKKTFKLGDTLPAAYAVWAQRINKPVEKSSSIADLLDRYALQVVPTKAPKTRVDNNRQIVRLRAVFGELTLTDLQPKDIYTYLDRRRNGHESKGLVSARREIALLSHAFTKAVEWGYIARHPFKGEIRLDGENPRTRYIEDWEIDECLALSAKPNDRATPMVQASIRIKCATGLRRGDILRIKISDIKTDGIHVSPHKTRKRSPKKIIFSWTPELRAAVQAAKDTHPVDISPWLFCTRRGECYVDEATGDAPGWSSLWKRFMRRVMTETKVTERFTEHDIRAKAGSDSGSAQSAQELLAHENLSTTQRIYRRKPRVVIPLK